MSVGSSPTGGVVNVLRLFKEAEAPETSQEQKVPPLLRNPGGIGQLGRPGKRGRNLHPSGKVWIIPTLDHMTRTLPSDPFVGALQHEGAELIRRVLDLHGRLDSDVRRPSFLEVFRFTLSRAEEEKLPALPPPPGDPSSKWACLSPRGGGGGGGG